MSASSITIDSFELARTARMVEGAVAIERLPRLAQSVTRPLGTLRYRIHGMMDDEGKPAADLYLQGRFDLTCQRCNAALSFDLDRTTRFRFVASEDELDSVPIDNDEIDAVVGSHAMNILEWIEDEAILSLPLVPRHAECSAPIKTHAGSSAVTSPNPFAVLLNLRNDKGGPTQHD